ncbi:Ser/Thr protein phosphatase [Tritrichomonas foetus]|uniref:Ser/Thr protein phosphatase n=1 Tax=Tritrichomonas foetus TaxID=1144522 RepID=A0A1J4J9R2_9EUKA|nr:Ser/Thr protein phosphatase [Tritrichomonas foetus]|eukprot:OHS94959.1 Ser/Thr protein phosphatase [Tritrichomonas foetus]
MTKTILKMYTDLPVVISNPILVDLSSSSQDSEDDPNDYTISRVPLTCVRIEDERILSSFRALVLSDMHFNQKEKLSFSLPIVLRKISKLIIDQNINIIFLLGDIVEQYQSPTSAEDLKTVFSAFEQLGIPIYIIPGNHDRSLFNNTSYDTRFKNIHLLKTTLMFIENPNSPPNTYRRIYMAHEMENNFKLEGPQKNVFPIKLKEFFKDVFTENDFLLIGHIHRHILDLSKNCGSVGQYSYDYKRESYAIITNENGFKIDFINEPEFSIPE